MYHMSHVLFANGGDDNAFMDIATYRLKRPRNPFIENLALIYFFFKQDVLKKVFFVTYFCFLELTV